MQKKKSINNHCRNKNNRDWSKCLASEQRRRRKEREEAEAKA